MSLCTAYEQVYRDGARARQRWASAHNHGLRHRPLTAAEEILIAPLRAWLRLSPAVRRVTPCESPA